MLAVFMCPVPVACAEHAPDIMDPVGMSIVNVRSSPDMIPENVPPIIVLGMPEKLMDPVTLEPFCVSCHVMLPMPDWPIIPPLPSVAVLESDAVPAQVPVTAIAEPGVVGELELPPHEAAAAIEPSSAAATSSFVIFNLMVKFGFGRACNQRLRFSRKGDTRRREKSTYWRRGRSDKGHDSCSVSPAA